MNGKTTPDAPALWDAAVEAEQRTGRHESTVEEARSHLVVRIVRVCGGFVVFLAGIALAVLPGPGLVLILAGLSILAIDIPFARRLRDVIVERADKATSFIPKSIKRALLDTSVVVGPGLSVLVLLR